MDHSSSTGGGSSSSSSFQRHFLVPFSSVPSRVSAKATLGGQSRADVMARCIVSALMISANTRNDSCMACVLLGGSPGVEPATLLCCGQHMRALQPTEKTVAGIISRALPPAPGHPGDLQELEAQGLLNNYDGSRNCCQGTWLRAGGVAAALEHLLTPALSGPHPVVLVLQEGAPPISTVLAAAVQPAQPPPSQQDNGRPTCQHQPAAAAAHPPPFSPPASSVITVLGDDAGLTADMLADVAAAAASCPGARLVHASLGPLQLLASQCITLVHHYLDLAVGPSDVTKPKFDPQDPWLDRIRPCRICHPPGLSLVAQPQLQQPQVQQQPQPQQPQQQGDTQHRGQPGSKVEQLHE